ncbi:MAG TPA: ABC transporter permease [Terriglobales bacterium]|nr:ABC transporter permease [Terriglobales bacterium]
MAGLGQDLRYALRQLRKSPGFTAVVVITLSLGIGANTSIFSLVNGVLLRPLEFPQEDQLVQLTDSYPQGALTAMRASFRTMEVAAYHDGDEMNLTGSGEPTRLGGTAVSANFFSVLGAHAEFGRTFRDGEDQPGKDNVVILSHSLWQRRFGSDPDAVGRTIVLEGIGREIVGVMPADFQLASSKPEFWVPLHLDSSALGAYWGGGFMPVLGRLRPGTTLEQAKAEVEAHIPQLRRMFPWRMPDALWASVSVITLRESLVGDVRTKLLVLLGAISLVLLIACTNVANLLLERAAVRQKEMAVRAALGAGLWRVCRQLLTESVLLGVVGGAGGLLLAMLTIPSLKAILPSDTPRLATVVIDWRVLALTAGVAFCTGVLFGIVPAFRVSQSDLTEAVRMGWQSSVTRTGERLRSALAIGELSLAVVLVIGAGLLARSMWRLSHVRPGFQSESILTARVTPNDSFCRDSARCRNFYHELLVRVQAEPGVEDAAIVNVLPLSGRIDLFSAELEDHPRNPSDPAAVILESIVSADYFRSVGISILRGRGFTADDMEPQAMPVALVAAATARKYWPNQDPVGKRVKRVWDKAWVTIIGVVSDVNEYSLASPLPSFVDGAVYRPYGNDVGKSGASPTEPTEMTLVVRTADNPSSLAAELRQIVVSINPTVPLSEIQTLTKVVSQSLASPRSTMILFAVFAGLAMILGIVGVYGVISYGVAQRVPEIGVRMALGAQRREVVWLVMKQGGSLALIGVAVGTAGAMFGTRLLSSLLFGVSTRDAVTYSAVSVLLILVALAASYIPARRAARVDPIVALRHE